MSLFYNIHRMAAAVIPREPFEYRIGLGTETSPSGRMVPKYSEWKRATGHIQPGIVSSFGGKNIEEKDYKDLGLDFSHRFMTIWCNLKSLTTIAGKTTTNQVRIRGMVFNVIHAADWIVFDGFRRVYVEEVMK